MFSGRVVAAFIACGTTGILPWTAEADLIGGGILEDTPTMFVAFVDHATPTPAGRRSLNTAQAGLFGGRRGENWHVIFEESITARKIFIDVTAQHIVAPHPEDGGIGEEFGVLLDVQPGGPFESSDDFTGFPLRVDHGAHEDLFVRWEYGPCGLCPPVPGQSRLTITVEHSPAPEATSMLLVGLSLVGLTAWRRRMARGAGRHS